jgi:hypothetical protein
MRIDDIQVEGRGFNVVKHHVVKRSSLNTDARAPAHPACLCPEQTPLAPEDVTRLTTDALAKFSPAALDAGANSTQAIRALEARHEAFWEANPTGAVIEEAPTVVQIVDAAPKRKRIRSVADFARRAAELWSGGGNDAA